MNKQTTIGLIIIGVILFGFSFFQSYQSRKAAEKQHVADSIAAANAPKPVEPVALDSLTVTAEDPLAAAAEIARPVEVSKVSIENDVMSIGFSSLGGAIESVVLKNYAQYGGAPLQLWRPGSETFDMSFFARNGFNDAQINTRNRNFEIDIPSGTTWAEGEEFKTLTMRLPVGGGNKAEARPEETPQDASAEPRAVAADATAATVQPCLEFVYTIPRNDYMVDFSVNFVGMEGLLSNQTNFTIDWAQTSLQNEKGFDNENNYTDIAYRFPDKKGIETLGVSRAEKSESETGKVRWVAFKQQFFSSILIAGDGTVGKDAATDEDSTFAGAEMSYATHKPGKATDVGQPIKDFKARVNVPMEAGRERYGFSWYFGPNKFSQLKQYDLQMERLVPLGGSIIGWISRLLVIPIFDWLGKMGLSFGWIILIMTVIIKLLIFPLTFTSYKSSAKMRVLKPEMDEINQRFPDKADAMKKQQATMELYQRAGINPMMGCIPMLIQFPIIIAMFRFFPAAIELRGERLWWADDLSSYDSIRDLGFNIPFYGDHISLFSLLMAISMFAYSWLNFKQQAVAPQMAGMKFMMLYAMPVMLLFWFNNYAAGLCFYYLLSNLFTIAQMYGVRFAINEEKLRKKMLETPRKPKKKSGFMARLEEAQKAQMAAARGQQQQQQKGGKKR